MSDFSTKSATQVGVGASNAIEFTHPKEDFRLLLNAYVTGTVTYDIEYTIDDVALNSCQYTTMGVLDRNASSDDSFYFPVRAVRVNVKSGDGTVKLVARYKD